MYGQGYSFTHLGWIGLNVHAIILVESMYLNKTKLFLSIMMFGGGFILTIIADSMFVKFANTHFESSDYQFIL